MKQNLIYASSLALLTSAFAIAQSIVPLNTVPTRILGHATGALNPLTVFPNLIEGREMWQPQGIALDTSVTPNVLYVSDYLNNRVLGWRNAQSFRNGEAANLVIGQSDFYRTTAGGPGTSFSTGLNSPMGLVVDRNGNLYIADQLNNRVLRFPRPHAQQGGQFPDMVIGQPNFNSNARALNDGGVSFSNSGFIIGLALDGDGNLWVVDGGNRRVLRYAAADLASGANGPKANIVIGQLDFTSTSPAVTAATRNVANVFAIPGGIAFDAAGRLYVTDTLADRSVARVLVFNPPFTNGQAAVRMMGVYVGSDNDAFAKTVLSGPSTVLFLPGNKMGVVDAFNHRILVFDSFERWPDAATSFSPQATAVYGQTSFSNSGLNGRTGNFLPGPTAATVSGPLAAVFSGTELLLADTGNNRVVALPYLQATGTFAPATRVLGQDGFTASAANLIEGREFAFRPSGSSADAGVALDETGDVPHLYVADTYNHRVLGYRDFRKLKAGAPFDKADIVIGQADFSSNLPNITGNPDAPTASTLAFPTGVLVDSRGDLWVADLGNSRVLRFPAPFARPAQLPSADVVLGQRNFTSKISDPSRTTMSQPYGLAINAQGLMVADVVHHRVLLFEFGANGSFSAADSGKAAAKVFGQPDFLTSSAGNADDKMNSPHHLATDNEGRLYVADSGTNRVLIFSDVAGSPQAGSRATLALSGFAQPRGVFVNGLTGEFWVAEANSGNVRRFPRYANLILNPAPIFTAQAAGSSLAVAQDQYGDLIVADGTNRIGIYYPSLQAINGGSFLTSKSFLAPGLLASICAPGSSCRADRASLFGPATEALSSFPMPRTLADTQVLFNDAPTPLYAVTPGQINFVVPMRAPQTGTAELQVIQASTGRVYAAGTVPMNSVNPAILMQTYEGTLRQAAVINVETGVPNGPNAPARRGSYIQIYATGQGFVEALADKDGEVVTGDIRTPGFLRVNLGGTYLEDFIPNPADPPKSEWLYASGMSQYPGLWYINVYIPSGVQANPQLRMLLLYNNVPSTDGSIQTTINVGN
jgi:uncharacterized protein (TIGR03437 family)